jgi:hypothetical protein
LAQAFGHRTAGNDGGADDRGGANSRGADKVEVTLLAAGVDGIIRAAGGRTPGPLGRDLSEATLFKHYPKDSAGWYYATSVFSDNISRIVTYRAVKDFPLIVTVGFSTTEIFSGLYAKKSAYSLVAAILTALILAVIGSAYGDAWR